MSLLCFFFFRRTCFLSRVIWCCLVVNFYFSSASHLRLFFLRVSLMRRVCRGVLLIMAAFEALKEDIVDVFQLFDEDGSGCISMEEVTRAIHTITGTHLSRIDLYSLIKAAKEDMNEEARVKGGQEGQCGPAVAKTTDGSGSQGADTEPDVVDSDLFVALVLKTLNRRTYEQELLFTFHLLEDKNYPGFITKESLKSATSDVGERLTEQEVNEMFDKLVTGVPTAAVDFTTFLSILDAARKLGD